MSNYKVVYNGLWQINILNVDINALDRVGTDPKAFEKLWYKNARNIGIQPIEPSQGILSQMVSFANRPEPRPLTLEDITDAVQSVFGRDEPSERRIPVQIGPRGHEAFQRAMQDEVRRQADILERSPMPPVVITTGGRSSGRTHNQRVQLEQARLERGEIDLLTYLDNISRDE